ncbi:hypothetical protein D3880_09965 [Pseudomonas cavernae]|uniref:DUF6160 domain-containing protein n=1 Tax=Pseudomonas cavernae TaxID=2320867 RepID=A0A385Z412_9PSED|nr:DUF6160 family protein [Pseudomonas cavernae]AYC32693.1 hypothetical protein D3880_09965 [Pseudomonas cavernae]
MKNFKQLVLAAALAAPFMAQADLKAMDDSTLASVTGQDGISIAGDFSGSIGNVAYTDDGGALNLNDIDITGFTIDDNAPLTVDVVTTSITPVGGGAAVATKQLAIGLPAMTGTVSVGKINVGGAYSAGALTGGSNIGGLAISDINMSGSTIKVWGH